MKKLTLAALASSMLFAGMANAHFQMIYTPEAQLEKPTNLDLKLVFGHPMENGHTMDMGTPEEFFVKFKNKKIDLLPTLKKIKWQGAHNTGVAYQADFKVKRNGDYIFGLVPAPYYEKSEDIYIQQYTKNYVNKGALPTNWNEPVGMKTEILPLSKPYQVFTGSVFTGQVLSNGKPVAKAECEVEFINTKVDLKNNKFGKELLGNVPTSGIVVTTDENGIFNLGVPKAGTWGVACLGAGPDTTYKGKELSQDAVIWVQAKDL